MSQFLDIFGQVKDPRQQGKIWYPLIEVIFLFIAAVISGADNFVDIELYGNTKIDFLRKIFPYKNGIPTHETLGEILGAIDSKKFMECFIQWTQILAREIKGVIAIDGKTVRGSYNESINQTALHIVTAWASHQKISLGQLKVNDKTNEITAIPNLLNLLYLKGSIVTIDAMGCQKEIAQTIIEKEADYVLALKQNHKDLYEDVSLFLQDKPLIDLPVEKDHGRIEIRRVCITSDIAWLKERHNAWANLKSIGMIESERIMKGKSSIERRYYISSLSDDPLVFAHAVRAHWGIENQLHWVLDMTFKEDSSRVRNKNAVENLALIRKIAHNLLQKNVAKMSLRGRRLRAGWDDAYLLEIIMSN